jgi:D-beta-D-heptose 7-phosphate kinase / D-beta-D-heptose 1-phosphate adenosyltransferase
MDTLTGDNGPEDPNGLEPGTADLVDAVKRLERASVMVIGDVMLDRYVYGEVVRVSPEAPVPIINVAREVAQPGGAGNVVRNLTALGAAVAFVSLVGDDQAGSDLTGLSFFCVFVTVIDSPSEPEITPVSPTCPPLSA